MILTGVILLGIITPIFRTNAGKLNTSMLGLLAVGIGLINSDRILSYPPLWLSIGLGLIALAIIGSTVFAGRKRLPEVALPSLQRCDGLLPWTMYLTLAAVGSFVNVAHMGALITALILTGTFISVVSILQRHKGLNIFLPGGVASGTVFQGRAWGTLANPLFLGGYLCLVFPLSAMWALSAGHWWAAAPAAVMAWALVASGTRSAWLGVLCALPVVSTKWLIGVVVPQALFGHRLKDAIKDSLHSTTSGRRYVWHETVKQIQSRPWFGHGLNLMAIPNPDPAAHDYYDTPHNELLYVTFHLGLVGLAGYLWIWGTTISHASVMFLPSFIAYFIYLQFAWTHIGAANVFWLLVGLAAAR